MFMRNTRTTALSMEEYDKVEEEVLRFSEGRRGMSKGSSRSRGPRMVRKDFFTGAVEEKIFKYYIYRYCGGWLNVISRLFKRYPGLRSWKDEEPRGEKDAWDELVRRVCPGMSRDRFT